jgi:hypothetical protein
VTVPSGTLRAAVVAAAPETAWGSAIAKLAVAKRREIVEKRMLIGQRKDPD